MVQGLLTEQRPMTTYRDREAQRFLHLLDDTNEVEPYLAVKTFHIRLLGEFALLANNLHTSLLDVPRLHSLLAYLALHRGMPQARSRIAYMLWPDSTDAQAHATLRYLLFQLRLTLPEVESFLLVERQTRGFQTNARFRLVVQDFEGAFAWAEQARCVQDAKTELQA